MDKSDYLKDSLSFVKKFQSYIEAKKSPYSAPAYNEKTVVYVDTVLYSSDCQKAAIFVIAKCFSETSHEWSYNGVVHFAGKVQDKLNKELDWKIYANHGARHILAETYKKMSDILRMRNFVYRSYEAHKKKITGYNIDDCRFWTSSAFTERTQSQGFVEIK